MDTSKQKKIEAALSRRYGMKPEVQANLSHFNETRNDWTGICRLCGEELSGTLAQLRAHKHGQSS